MGQAFSCALPSVVIALVTPGPETTSAAPICPLMYEAACAAYPAAASWRVPM